MNKKNINELGKRHEIVLSVGKQIYEYNNIISMCRFGNGVYAGLNWGKTY